MLRHIPISDTSGGLRCIFSFTDILAAGAAGLQRDRILIKHKQENIYGIYRGRESAKNI